MQLPLASTASLLFHLKTNTKKKKKKKCSGLLTALFFGLLDSVLSMLMLCGKWGKHMESVSLRGCPQRVLQPAVVLAGACPSHPGPGCCLGGSATHHQPRHFPSSPWALTMASQNHGLYIFNFSMKPVFNSYYFHTTR